MGTNLSERVQANAVARRDAGAVTLQQQIRSMEHQFAMAMPKGVEAAQLVRDVLTCLSTTPKLMQANPVTVLGAAMTCAQLGLRPGVGALGHAWILPFYNGRARETQAQLIIGYQGYADLANRSGQIASQAARVVYENDHLDYEYGLDERLVHRPAMSGDRGEPIAYYAVVKTTTGGRYFEIMSRPEVEAHRDRFAMARTKDGRIIGPWADHFDGMAKKTAYLRLKPWLPRSTEVMQAIAADNTVRLDYSPKATPDEVSEYVDLTDAEVLDDTPTETPGGQA